MLIYQDKNGMWNDKPVNANKDPSCQNNFIYTLYAEILNLSVKSVEVTDFYNHCAKFVAPGEIVIQRRPDVVNPPFSADEAIGAYGLWRLGTIRSKKALSYDMLKANHFVFHGKGKPLKLGMLQSIMQGIAKLLLSIKVNPFLSKSRQAKMRNLFWRREIEELYQIAFRLHPAFITMIQRIENKPRHKENEIVFDFHFDNLIKSKDRSHGFYSQKNIMWALLVLNGDESKARKLKPWESFERYFGSEHPFTIAMRKRYNR